MIKKLLVFCAITLSAFSSLSADTLRNELEAFEQRVTLQMLFQTLTDDFLRESLVAALEEQGIDSESLRGKAAMLFTKNILEQFNARLVTAEEAPAYHAIVEQLCARLNIEKPILCLSSSFANACARNIPGLPKIVVFGTPLLKRLTDAECEAILAHELGHLKHNHFAKLVAFNIGCSILSLTSIYAFGEWFKKQYTPNGNPFALPKKAYRDLALFHIPHTGACIASIFAFLKLSRSYEYQADAEASYILGSSDAVAGFITQDETGQTPMALVAAQIAELEAQIANPNTSAIKRAGYRLQKALIMLSLTHPLPKDRKAALLSPAPAA